MSEGIPGEVALGFKPEASQVSSPTKPQQVNPEVRTTSRERVPQAEIETAVEEYKQRYRLSETILGRAKDVEAYFLGPEELTREFEATYNERLEYVRELRRRQIEQRIMQRGGNLTNEDAALLGMFDEIGREEDMAKIEKYKKQAKTEVARTGGVEIHKRDGRQMILLNAASKIGIARAQILRHELLHALASRGFSQGSGFREGLDSVGILDHGALNEGATEVLRIASQFPENDPIVLYRMVKGRKIPVAYRREVEGLLGALAATYLEGGEPVSFDDLAKFYFGLAEADPREISAKFFDRLDAGVPERYRNIITDLKFNIFQAF